MEDEWNDVQCQMDRNEARLLEVTGMAPEASDSQVKKLLEKDTFIGYDLEEVQTEVGRLFGLYTKEDAGDLPKSNLGKDPERPRDIDVLRYVKGKKLDKCPAWQTHYHNLTPADFRANNVPLSERVAIPTIFLRNAIPTIFLRNATDRDTVLAGRLTLFLALEGWDDHRAKAKIPDESAAAENPDQLTQI